MCLATGPLTLCAAACATCHFRPGTQAAYSDLRILDAPPASNSLELICLAQHSEPQGCCKCIRFRELVASELRAPSQKPTLEIRQREPRS